MSESKKAAYYIIDAPTVFANSPSAALEGVPNGWNGDNRFLDISDLSDPKRFIRMENHGEKDRFFSVNRPFRAEKDGILTLELMLDVRSRDNGVYVAFTDSEGKTVLTVGIKDGKWGLFGVAQSISEVEVGEKIEKLYSFVINLDLDRLCAFGSVNNRSLGKVDIEKNGVGRLKIGIEKGGDGTAELQYARMWKNYAVNDHFAVTSESEGQVPLDWSVTGSFGMYSISSCKGLETYSMKSVTKKGEASTAAKDFSPQSGLFCLEACILLPEKTDGARVSFTENGREVLTIESKNGVLMLGEDVLNDYIPNIWQTLCIDADAKNGTALVKVNGKKRLEITLDAHFIDGVKITFAPENGGVMWFDDVKAYPLEMPSDYPQITKSVDTSPYVIGTNVCWLWRDFNCGEGWDSVSAFPEFEPCFGYYDEGSREYADWELKTLYEHGFGFIHACWYSPTNDSDAPIKNEDYSYSALHDGYMNAKYSDLVKFCIMWENSFGYDGDGFEKFRKRLWNYWVEYYFKDSRYLRFDNKAVLTVFKPECMEKTFGGREGVRKAVEFMNGDIKKYGYDGIILLSDDEFYKSYDYLNSLGFDGSYAYQWGKSGYNRNYQTEQNRKFSHLAKSGHSHHIPTVSVGFNLVGRAFVRSGFINKADHREVCEDIKKLMSESLYGDWRDKAVMVSTWNEYSEGHFVCPTKSIGFDLIENVRDVFGKNMWEQQGAEIITDEQKLRINRMYPPCHSPLRRLSLVERDYDEYIKNKNYTAVRSVDKGLWSSTNSVKALSFENGVISGFSDGGDPQLINSQKLNINADVVSALHIRMKATAPSDDCIEVFFATKSSPCFSSDKGMNCPLKKSEDFEDYYFICESQSLWQGIVTELRIDPVGNEGSFEIGELELIRFSGVPKVFKGKTRIAFPFPPKRLENDLEVCADRYFFLLTGLYYEWDRFTENGVLTLKNRVGRKIVLYVGKDTASLDGETVPCGFVPKLRDGLPVLNLFSFLTLVGKEYSVKGNNIYIED